MTHPLMYNFLSVALFTISTTPCNAACSIEKLPPTRSSRCSEFLVENKKLNSTYKTLLSKNSALDNKKLRSTQLNWIKWRDEKCDEIQELIKCGNSLCDGVAHDQCIIELTIRRESELRKLIGKDAKNLDFSFDTKYSYEY